jgi:hypothetical protein
MRPTKPAAVFLQLLAIGAVLYGLILLGAYGLSWSGVGLLLLGLLGNRWAVRILAPPS